MLAASVAFLGVAPARAGGPGYGYGVPIPPRSGADTRGGFGAPTMTLGFHGGVDTVPVHGWRYRAYHPFHYGYYRPYAYSYYRPFAYSYYRPYAFYPRYSSFYLGFNLYRPYYYSLYTPPAYYGPAFYYDYCPIGGGVMPYVSVLAVNPSVFTLRPYLDALTPPQPYAGPQTYPYNGDPQDSVPMPKAVPEPTAVPPSTIPTGRLVSMPARPSSFAFPAYGDAPTRTSFAADRDVLIHLPVPGRLTRDVRLPR
jgi:hypothetical protein